MNEKEAIQKELGKRLLLGELMARNARKFPEKEALVYGETRLTYKQLNARINQIAHALLDLGIHKNDKVAILAYNCNQFLETYFALAKIGGVAVPVNFRLHPEEMTYILNQSDSKALIAGEDFLATVKDIQKDLPQVATYISIGEKLEEGMLNFEQWISGFPGDEPLILVDDDEPLFIMYTAGTTGRPKGAVITHRNEMVLWMLGASFVLTEPGLTDLWTFRALSAPPVFHLASFGFCQFMFFLGATVVLPTEVFDPAQIMRIIEQEKINAIVLIPVMSTFLLMLPDLDKYDTRSLQVWGSSGAILSVETRQQIKNFFPNVKIFDLFGQTEMSALVSGLLPSESEGRETSVGKILPFIEIRVVDDDDNDVSVGAVGEAVYRAPSVMKEYYKNPEATAESMRGGWFHGGDLVRQDEQGYIYVVDRKKDMIVSGGENIYSAEIEMVLSRHPKIMESSVIGVYDKDWGEAVKAVVVLKPGETMTQEEVIDFCKEHLASYKKPKSVNFVEALPRNALGKVLKRELREQYGKSMRY
ncbi:MAG: long-chain-fatty-acid--CoA ligase [Deltaproteobacteria bacterium]|nr:long-chain-fatty-acid--CoA ligase [Deltaproteobacteria bacterium]